MFSRKLGDNIKLTKKSSLNGFRGYPTAGSFSGGCQSGKFNRYHTCELRERNLKFCLSVFKIDDCSNNPRGSKTDSVSRFSCLFEPKYKTTILMILCLLAGLPTHHSV